MRTDAHRKHMAAARRHTEHCEPHEETAIRRNGRHTGIQPDATPVNDGPAPGPEQRPQPATSSITNVAAMAHVSIATVSRVLSGKRTKDDDIARRVRAAAEELNYSVN